MNKTKLKRFKDFKNESLSDEFDVNSDNNSDSGTESTSSIPNTQYMNKHMKILCDKLGISCNSNVLKYKNALITYDERKNKYIVNGEIMDSLEETLNYISVFID